MKRPRLYDERDWPYVRTLLPPDLEDSARQSEALIRCRNVPDAAALLRMALAYAVSDLSLKDVAAWANALGLAQITGPGLFYRLREAETWLQRVLAQTLKNQLAAGAESRLRLRVVDATVIHGPGATGTEWRAHVLMDPGTGGFRAVELTDAQGGEGYGRYRVRAQEVILGDRAYATARGLWAIQSAQAYVVARLNPHTIRVCDERRQRISLRSQEKEVPKVGGVEFNILVPIPPEKRTKTHKWGLTRAIAWVPARAVAARTREGTVIWLLTTLSAEQASWRELMELYRLRWQIELFFKRLKSLLHLDALPSRQGPTAKSWMLVRFLAAALAQRLVQPAGPLSPWGYELRETRGTCIDHSTLSPDFGTNGRSPEVSSTAFGTQPPDLQPPPLMDMGFVVLCQLARHRMPRIWFLYIGSRLGSALLSDLPSPERPCASLSLHLHQVVKGTFTLELVEHARHTNKSAQQEAGRLNATGLCKASRNRPSIRTAKCAPPCRCCWAGPTQFCRSAVRSRASHPTE